MYSRDILGRRSGERKDRHSRDTQTRLIQLHSRLMARVMSGSDDKTVRVWNATSGEIEHVLEGHSGPVESVAFSPDGKYIVSGSHWRH